MDANANHVWSIGQNIATIRRRRGLTLEGLSELSSVSRASISALENGADNPRVQTLWNLADALGVNFGILIGDGEVESILDDDGGSVQLIDRQTSPKIVEAYRLDIPAGVTRKAKPHVSGVQEHVVVLSGELLTGPQDAPSLLTPGQSASFAADVAHIYSAGQTRARAIVTVVYPRLDDDIAPDQELNWPQTRADWETVASLITRATIEVQNGLGVNVKTFHLPAQVSVEKATFELRKSVAALPCSPTVRRFVIADTALGVLSLYRTSQMTSLDSATGLAGGSLAKRCLELAALATARPGTYDLNQIHRIVSESSSVTESALAAEILTRNGRPTVPHGVGTVKRPQEDVNAETRRLFEARINVDAYEACELVRPAYARQTLALACHLPRANGLKILDVGTGPGLPLAMLLELRPDIHALAVDPSQVAVEHLAQRFAEDANVEIQQASITELERRDRCFEVAVSIGASHHLDTSAFLTAIREQMKRGGRVLIADEMICTFTSRQERDAALIRHHLWYILDTLVEIPEDSHKGDVQLAQRLAQVLPKAMGMAHSGRSNVARRTIRELFEDVMAIKRPLQPSHPRAVFSRFHLLELQALIAGFDYEIEQKTSPQRFKALVQANGFDIKNHQRIYATDGDRLDDAGTHLWVMEAV